MIRKLCFAIVAVTVLATAMWAETADEIIAKNIQARGGADKLASVQTVKACTSRPPWPWDPAWKHRWY
jgi:hypothetical protein